MRNDIKIQFNWDIHWKCNYNCKYCWFYGKWEEVKRKNFYPEISVVIEAWRRIYNLYKEVKISITGGEPFIYPNFKKLIKEISKYHYIEIITNLSVNIDDFVEQVNPKRITINPSFHPELSNMDIFIKRAKLLEKYGFLRAITIVAYPPYIEEIDKYKQEFKKQNLKLTVQTFYGIYNDKIYPDSYTEEEKKIIYPDLGERGGEKFRIEPIATRGKLCYAGVIYGVVHPDGVVLRCGGADEETGKVGNIFDRDFKLLGKPEECYYDMCPCNEWAFLLEEKHHRVNL